MKKASLIVGLILISLTGLENLYGQGLEIVDQNQPEHNYGYWFDDDVVRWQEFIPTLDNLTAAGIFIGRIDFAGNVIVEIRDMSNNVLAQEIIPEVSVPLHGWYKVSFSNTLDLTIGTKYRIYVYTDQNSPDPQHRYFWRGDMDSPYHPECDSDIESHHPGYDYTFQTYGHLSSLWSSPSKNLSQTPAKSAYPHTAVADNYVHVIWIEDGLFRYKRSTDGGATWGTEHQLTIGGDIYGGPYGTAIDAVDSYVHVTMCWRGSSAEDHEIYYTRSTDYGETFEAWRQITFNTTESRIPDIAVRGSYVHIVYADKWPGYWDIMYKRIADYGAGAILSRRLSYSSGISYKPAIAVSQDGSLVHVVYTDDYPGIPDLFYKRILNYGIGTIETKRLTFGGGESRYSDITTSTGFDDQYVFIAYVDNWAGNNEIIFKRISNYGTGTVSTILMTYSPNDSLYPRIAFDELGTNVYIVYSDITPGNWTIFDKKISNHGSGSWLTRRLSFGLGISEKPNIYAKGGRAYAVWNDNTTGNHEILFKIEY